jgi:hypothetical protein
MAITAGKLVKLYQADPENYEDELDRLLGVTEDDDRFRCVRDPVFRPRQISVLDVGEAFVGREGLRRIWQRPYGMRGGRAHTRPDGTWAAEEVGGGAMGPSQFQALNAWMSTIAGLFGAELLAQSESAVQLARELVSWKMDVRVQEPMMVRYGIPTAPNEDLQPSQEFPSGDIGSDWVRANRMRKQGEALAITWEAAHFDWTDTILDAASGPTGLAMRLSLVVNERVERAIWGVENTYNRQGTITNTYRTTGNYVNMQDNPLLDIPSLDKAEQQLLSQTDPASGLEIVPPSPQRTLITGIFNRLLAERLANPLGVNVGSLTSDERIDATKFYQPFQVISSIRAIRIMTSAYPGWTPITSTQAQKRWVWGDTKAAFVYRSAKDITTYRFDITDSPALARRDVLMELDASEMGSVTVMEPRAVVLNHDDS